MKEIRLVPRDESELRISDDDSQECSPSQHEGVSMRPLEKSLSSVLVLIVSFSGIFTLST